MNVISEKDRLNTIYTQIFRKPDSGLRMSGVGLIANVKLSILGFVKGVNTSIYTNRNYTNMYVTNETTLHNEKTTLKRKKV